MADAIKLIECPRDAWQGLKGQIPTEVKVNYLRALIAAGFKHIDAVSFVAPKAVPQMADSEDVLEQLDPPDDVEIIGIVVNEKGVERAIGSAAVRTVGFPYSVSPSFLKNNQKQTLDQAVDTLEKIKQQADEAGMDTVAYISMAFGNPYGDLWNDEEVLEAVGIIADMDIKQVSLADTVGVADRETIGRVLGAVMDKFGDQLEIGAHLHGRAESAVGKVLAAYDAGIRRFDSAVGGLGGCPFAQDMLVGNIPTERLVEGLRDRGVALPVRKPLDPVLAMSADIAQKFSAEVRH
jgi:hydroxymethylglutaryl-CoA lyase